MADGGRRAQINRVARWTSIVLGVAVVLAGGVWAIGAFVDSLGGSDNQSQAALSSTASSWVPGQPSLADDPRFASFDQRANEQGDARGRARITQLAQIAAARLVAKRVAVAAERARLERERQLALKRHAEAVRRAKELAALAKQKAAEAHRKYLEKLREFRKQLHVPAGDECTLPEVQKVFDCSSGTLPTPNQ